MGIIINERKIKIFFEFSKFSTVRFIMVLRNFEEKWTLSVSRGL